MANNRLNVEVESGKYFLLSNGKMVTPEKVSMGGKKHHSTVLLFHPNSY